MFIGWNGLCLGIGRQQKPITNLFMAFDPTLPANNSLVSSAELRSQFNGLQEQIIFLQDEVDDTPHNTNGIAQLSLTISNPPTQAEVTAIRDKINEMLTVMFR